MTRCPGALPALLLLLLPHAAISGESSDLNQRIASNRAIRQVALAPDGRTVVAAITDPTTAGGRAHLWILSTTGSPTQITGLGDDRLAEDADPQWTTDGSQVLYLEKSAEGAALRRIDVRSRSIETFTPAGWGRPPAGRPAIVKGFSLAPSGALAFWAADGTDAAERAARQDDAHRFGQNQPVRLYVTEGGHTDVIDLPGDVRTVAWNRDGRQLLAVTEPASDDLGTPNRLWSLGPERAPHELSGTAANVQAVAWLPDGRLTYFARCAQDTPIVCEDLYVQALDGTPPRNLTDGIDGSLVPGSDNPAASGPLVTRSGEVLVTVARGFGQTVARIRPTDGRIQWMTALPAVVRSLAPNANATAVAMLAADHGGATYAYLVDPLLRSPQRLAAPELEPPAWQPLVGRRLHWPSGDRTIEALLYLPADARNDARCPLVVDVHGGPAGRFEDVDYPLLRLMLAEGWAVLHVNPRGSVGYGAAFLASLKDDLGGGDYDDIMRGIDTALAQAPLDGGRLAMIGYSYGATITTFALGRTRRFKALVAAAPVVDQISEYGTEASSWYDRWYFGQPWRRLDAAWRQSPLAGVASATTPLLLLQGESDPVNPPGQSFELYRALRQQGSPVELMLFPRETHRELGQNYYGNPSVEPHHGVALRGRLLDFLRDAFAGRPNAGLAVE